MILHDYWRSSAAYRVRIGLNLLGLDATHVTVDLAQGDQRRPDHLLRNPQGLIPTLDVDGLTLTQSLAILEYLHETRGALLPPDPAGRARARAIAYAVAMEIGPLCNLSVRNHVQALTQGRVTADDWQRHYIQRGLAAVEAMLTHPATGRYCHGDQVSLADICLVPQVYNARRLHLDLAAMPQITRIIDTLETLPAVQAAHPDRHNPKASP